ncbi:isoprenylcysteine carboxylmethyltransferase family protein [Thalassotalea maritima]|uniref:methyltransferase family protein n=1 Tax=Thalassotalea maritima TaxID=3242416 RepID=UPI003527F007
MTEKISHNETADTLSFRQWRKIVVSYLVMPLILLLCGGDFGWWQAWVYSLILVVAGIVGHMWAEYRHPGIITARQSAKSFHHAKPWDKILAPLMAISIVIPLLIVAGLDHRYQLSPEFPLWLNILGLLFVALGYGFASWAMAENRFFISVVRIQHERGHQVCDTGPYQFVRHPGYTGSLLPLFGIALALGSVWTLIPALLATLITIIRIMLEDKTLQQELPGYRDYAQRVRYRLLPGLF